MFKDILVAVDGTSTAQRGLKIAVDLAADQQATLHVVHVVDTAVVVPLDAPHVPADYLESMVRAMRETGRSLLAKAASFATERGVQVRTVLLESRGGPVAAKLLLEAKKRKAELIVLGTHGRRGLRRLLLGSDAEMVLRDARIPVLLVRAPERAGVKHRDGMNKRASATGRRATAPARSSLPRTLAGTT